MAREKKPDTRPMVSKIVTDDEPEVVLEPSVVGGREAKRPVISDIPSEAAVLTVRNMVLFPGTVIPLAVGREKSLNLIETVLPEQKVLVTVCQRDPDQDDPGPDDLYQFGTAVLVVKLLRVDPDTLSAIVHALGRVRIDSWSQSEPFFRAKITAMQDVFIPSTHTKALELNARSLASRVIELSPSIPDEASLVVSNIEYPGALADFLGANLQLDLSLRQKLLEQLDVAKRLDEVGVAMQKQLEVLELSQDIQNRVRDNIDKSQRQYFLQQQLKEIQKELGQTDEQGVEIEELREKIEAAGMPEPVKTEAVKELDRLERIPSASPEYNMIRTYMEWMTELPWSKRTVDNLNVNRARRILNKDHYDLAKVKRRILEYLAVRKLAPESRGPILCFVGPPGVGKTSLGRSIARALGREFIRMSLGGMRDEAELRGHRRTYIGAMPGRIIQEIRKAGACNPVFMLDELDKVGMDFRGDPTAALLEVLDPAQNYSFQDHYLNAPFDLSNVMFIATANYMAPVPAALRDRMETIEIPGYTPREKMHIARNYLVPRQMSENGLLKETPVKSAKGRRKRTKTVKLVNWTLPALRTVIRSYTREAGVRELERQIGSVCRAIAAKVASGKAPDNKASKITAASVGDILGPPIYISEVALRASSGNVSGVVTGLAYTPSGGDILFIEAAGYRAVSGEGRLTLTGHIGDVMKESAMAALTLIKSNAEKLSLDPAEISRTAIHVHVPAGAVPKDGPSAGAAICTAIVSMLTGRPVRYRLAMTGEITLRGLILPIGGVKQKVLAAKLAGIKTVILPERNRKDMVDVPPEARQGIKFEFVENIDQVLKIALR
ncbi:MAG: endopeptidase La [Phycisphaerae bacterium]|jgi:ATP-dependent Lon protease|nr:endopeptidase La [Phycisphaerae bacterium]